MLTVFGRELFSEYFSAKKVYQVLIRLYARYPRIKEFPQGRGVRHGTRSQGGFFVDFRK